MNRLPDIDAVTSLLGEVVEEIVLPRFGKLSEEEIGSKVTAAGRTELVTAIDLRVEERLGRALQALAPSVPIVGEESSHHRPELLETLEDAGPVWLLDPIDGTKNFARGGDAFGVMLAWVLEGRARAAWILLPARGRVFVAEEGSGTFRNGVRVEAPADRPGDRLRGSLHLNHMPRPLATFLETGTRGRYHETPSSGCAAIEYTGLVEGRKEFAVYHRLHPWDHTPGALILSEAGGRVEHRDGTSYTPRARHRLTVAAGNGAVARRVRAWLPADPVP